MPRIAVVFGIFSVVVFSLAFNIHCYPAVWEMFSSPGLAGPSSLPKVEPGATHNHNTIPIQLASGIQFPTKEFCDHVPIADSRTTSPVCEVSAIPSGPSGMNYEETAAWPQTDEYSRATKDAMDFDPIVKDHQLSERSHTPEAFEPFSTDRSRRVVGDSDNEFVGDSVTEWPAETSPVAKFVSNVPQNELPGDFVGSGRPLVPVPLADVSESAEHANSSYLVSTVGSTYANSGGVGMVNDRPARLPSVSRILVVVNDSANVGMSGGPIPVYPRTGM